MLRMLVLLLISGSMHVQAAQPLRVGLAPDYPPLAFTQDGRVLGIEADNARAVGKILDRQVVTVQLPFEQLITALRAGTVDVIMSGMSITGQRSKQVQFCEPYLHTGQMAILHRSKVAAFAQPWAIYREGVRVGVEQGTAGAGFAERELEQAIVSYYPSPEQGFAALRSDKIDLFLHDAATSWQLATASENDDLISLYKPLTDEELAWAVRLDDRALAAELNRALRLMKNNGTLRYILNRWIPVTVEMP